MESIDAEKQYEALKYCLRKSRWFNMLFLSGLFIVAFATQFTMENIANLFGVTMDGWPYYSFVFASSIVAVFVFIIYMVNTYIHNQVIKHIDEFKSKT